MRNPVVASRVLWCFNVALFWGGLVIFPPAAGAAGPTYVGGGLGPNAHWTLAGSPYEGAYSPAIFIEICALPPVCIPKTIRSPTTRKTLR